MDPLTDPAGGNLLTTRLRLRSWRDDDVTRMLAMSTDPEVMRHFPRPMTADEVRGFVGLAEPTFEAPFTPCVEIGWRLVRGAWGQGLVTEAAREVLRHGFSSLGLHEIVSFTAIRNERSIAVMRRLGMHRAQEFDHPRVPEGHEVRRHVLYRLAADEWRESRSRATGPG